MRIVDLRQNTPEWLAWRSEVGCIGASDAPAICGRDKYTSPRMLYSQKVNGEPSNISDFMKDRAHFYETRSHAMSGIVLSCQYERDVCAEHSEYSFIRASFDGINFEFRRFWENKYCGVKEFEAIKRGPKSINIQNVRRSKTNIILGRYLPQLAQQSFVSGFRVCDFTVYNDQEDDVANIEVHMNSKFTKSVMGKVFAFRNLLLVKTPPPLMDMDTLTIDDKKSVDLFQALIESVRGGKKKDEEKIRAEISRSMPHRRIECLGIHAIKTKDGKTIFRNLKKAVQAADHKG